jgi:hypothetical protein
MKKLICLLLLLFLPLTALTQDKIYNFNCRACAASFPKIMQFSEVDHSLIDEHTLILVDIDNTICRAAGHYGSMSHFSHMVKNELIGKKQPYFQAQNTVYDHWAKASHFLKSELNDENLPEFIKFAKQKKATIIAFTARRPDIVKELTAKQLASHAIKMDDLPGFNFEKHYKNQIFPDKFWCDHQSNPNACLKNTPKRYHYSQALFYRGILFTHDLNTKGLVFADFYAKFYEYLKAKNLPLPSKVIMVDDLLTNLNSMHETSQKLGLDFYGYQIFDYFEFDETKLAEEEQQFIPAEASIYTSK